MFNDREENRKIVKKLASELRASQNVVKTLKDYEPFFETSYAIGSLFSILKYNPADHSISSTFSLPEIHSLLSSLLFDIPGPNHTDSSLFEDASLHTMWSGGANSQFSKSVRHISKRNNRKILLRDISFRVKRLLDESKTSDYLTIVDKLAKEHDFSIQQNIKRRAYDAINVMLAAGLLSKEGKHVEILHNRENDPFEEKRRKLRTRLEKFSAYKNLCWRNAESNKKAEILFLPVHLIYASAEFSYRLTSTERGCELTVTSYGQIRFIEEADVVRQIQFDKKLKVVPQEVYNLVNSLY